MLTHGNLFWNTVYALLCFDVSQDDVSLVAAPLFHIGGLNVTTLVTLQKGGQIVLMPAFDPGQALKLIAEYRVTSVVTFSPPMWNRGAATSETSS